MRRRSFLKTVTTIVLAMAARPATAGVPGDAVIEDEAVMLADRLLAAYPSRSSLAAIGRAYDGEASPSPTIVEPGLPGAVTDLLTRLDLAAARLHEMEPDDIRSSIRIRTANDFADGRTLSVRGWLLGETEARLCRIAALRAA